jgi:hypothetical protein
MGGSPASPDHLCLSSWLSASGLIPGEEHSDLDFDGRSAILEYALGTEPNDPGDGGVLTATSQTLTVGPLTDDYLVLCYPRRKGADDAILSAEFSTDLINWQSAGPVVSLTATADPAIELVCVRGPSTMDGAIRQFLRLRVEPEEP